MRTITSEFGRSFVATFFLAVMVVGPVCAVGGVIVSSLGANLVSLITTAMRLA